MCIAPHQQGLFHHLYVPYEAVFILSNFLFLFLQANDYVGLVIFCIFFGMSYGMVGALQFEVLMAIVGTEKFSSAIGLVLLIEAIAVLVGPPGAGQCMEEMNMNVSLLTFNSLTHLFIFIHRTHNFHNV